MGYTHYMSKKRAFTDAEWKEFMAKARTILAKHADILANGDGTEGTIPEITTRFVSFNGRDSDSHETCFIDKQVKEFDFCKTARKPYDVAVVEIYKLVKSILSDGVEISSDGGPEVFA